MMSLTSLNPGKNRATAAAAKQRPAVTLPCCRGRHPHPHSLLKPLFQRSNGRGHLRSHLEPGQMEDGIVWSHPLCCSPPRARHISQLTPQDGRAKWGHTWNQARSKMALWCATHCAVALRTPGMLGASSCGSSAVPSTIDTCPSSSPMAIHLPWLKLDTCHARTHALNIFKFALFPPEEARCSCRQAACERLPKIYPLSDSPARQYSAVGRCSVYIAPPASRPYMLLSKAKSAVWCFLGTCFTTY